jgi:cytoskeletal protein RodZ
MRKQQKPSALQLEQIQAAKLQEIGAYLRQAREQRQMSLDQVASVTKIQRRLLQLIESGQQAGLPEPVYIQALILRFGDAVGVQGIELAQQFPLTLGGRRSGRFTFYLSALSLGHLRPVHLYLLYIGIIFAAVNGLSTMMTRSLSQNQPTPASLLLLNPDASSLRLQESPPAAKGEASLVRVPEELAAPAHQAFPLLASLGQASGRWLDNSSQLLAQLPDLPNPQGKPVAVKVTVETQSWLRVTVDDGVVFEGIMLAGSQHDWAGDRAITIRAGNAGGVKVSFNGAGDRPLGPVGSVEEVTYHLPSKTSNTLALAAEN